MTWIEDLLLDTRFWACHFVGSSGQVAPGLDEAGCDEFFGMSPDDAWNWLKEATDIGSGKEIGIRIAQNEGVSLHLDLTEEMDYWIENDSGSESFLLANVGGHWLLPGLRWGELMGISQYAHPTLPKPKASSLVKALLLPSVWFCDESELKEASCVLPTVFLEIGFVADPQKATALSDAWVRSVDATPHAQPHTWQQDQKGWWSSSKYSCRSKSSEDRLEINLLIERLANAS